MYDMPAENSLHLGIMTTRSRHEESCNKRRDGHESKKYVLHIGLCIYISQRYEIRDTLYAKHDCYLMLSRDNRYQITLNRFSVNLHGPDTLADTFRILNGNIVD